jgi:hypothetical protein
MATVDTFEHDIENEIRSKEASISDITDTIQDIGNDPVPNQHKQSVFIMMLAFILCGISVAGYFGYTYYAAMITPKVQQPTKNITTQKITQGSTLGSISKTLDQSIGTFITKTEKTSDGYIITISSYPSVFSYMLRNEKDFGDEIALAVGNTHIVKEVELATTTQNGTTTLASTKNSTSTLIASSTQKKEIEKPQTTEYIFSDITVSNQNMRTATSIYGTVLYAFIGTQKLVIASSPEKILALRGNLLKK